MVTLIPVFILFKGLRVVNEACFWLLPLADSWEVELSEDGTTFNHSPIKRLCTSDSE